MTTHTLCGVAPEACLTDRTTFGLGPAPLPSSAPLPRRENGRAIYTDAVQSLARLAGYARRTGKPELESKALQAIETLLELLP